MTIKLIAGLCNPGPAYEKTRHNAGAWLVKSLASQYNGQFKADKKFHGAVSTIHIDNHECKLLIPSTFMNHSGQAVQAATHFYKIKPEEILIVHDDLDLLPGIIKFKSGGGHGGHNGLRHIISCLNSQQFHRLRVGIGHPGHRDQVLNYVLGTPSKADVSAIHLGIHDAIRVLPDAISGDMQKAMHILHT